MSRGLGKVQRKVIELLGEKGAIPVTLLSMYYCDSYRIGYNTPIGVSKYQSVTRAVRSLERKKMVKTKKVPAKEINPNFLYQRYARKGLILPVYVKMVWLIDGR